MFTHDTIVIGVILTGILWLVSYVGINQITQSWKDSNNRRFAAVFGSTMITAVIIRLAHLIRI